MPKDVLSTDGAQIDLHLAVLNDPRKDSVEIDFLLEILCEGMGKHILLFYLFVSVLNIDVHIRIKGEVGAIKLV